MLKIVSEKKVFPISIGDFCQLLNRFFTTYDVDLSSNISCIVVSDNAPIKQDCLFIPYDESDDQCKIAVEKGASAVLADHPITAVPTIVVEDPVKALNSINEWLFHFIELPSIVICGSEGKTTTKRMTLSVLSTEKKVFADYGNYNTFQALCCSLQRVIDGSELIIQEVDESRKLNPSLCSKVLKPSVAMVTNIAEAHLGCWGSKEALTEQFLGITDGMKKDGVVIINADDQSCIDAGFNARIISVGINNPEADCRAERIKNSPNGTCFDLKYQDETVHVRLSVFGEHNVYNAMMAYVVGKQFGLKTSNILKGLKKYRNSGIRQNTIMHHGILVYADCYNASATSVEFALKCFDNITLRRLGKKAAVLGDIAEIEGFEEDTYCRVAAAIDKTGINTVVTYGEESKRILSAVKRDVEKIHTDNMDELVDTLKRLQKEHCRSFLFKASRVMELEKAIQYAFPKHNEIIEYQDRIVRTKVKIKRILRRR